MDTIKWVKNTMPKTADAQLDIMNLQTVQTARAFHGSFAQYTLTPLANLANMAQTLGLASLHVKDESYRFGLNAFKVLGGSFAIGRYIAQKTGKDIRQLDYQTLRSQECRQSFAQATFFTATDGNHGRGVAWSANQLGQKAVVFMPKGTQQIRLDNILKENADASIQSVNYDECVRMAAAAAQKTENGVVVQDTAWQGYEEIPSWIMQGYGTMASEAAEQLQQRPTHIFIQAGVGSLAGAIIGYFTNLYKDNPPVMCVVEADAADCLYLSACNQDGSTTNVSGDMPTMMAGLACGEPNSAAWDILQNHADYFFSCPDCISAKGMRMLGAPLKGDAQVISGESGAVPMGLLATLMQDTRYAQLRAQMGLNQTAKVLLFSTEGDTDPQNYRDIVWNGKLALQ